MSTLQTDLTRLLGMKKQFIVRVNLSVAQAPLSGIQTPIVLAPMAGASGGALASEVSLAGGFGFLSPSPGEACPLPPTSRRLVEEGCGTTASVFTGVEKFRDELDIARSMLNIPSGPLLPIGAGFLGWKLDEAGSQLVPLLELALENGVRAIWLSFGKDLGRWIEFVRNHDQTSGKSPKTLVFVQVNSADDALIAVQAWKVDVLVAQGTVPTVFFDPSPPWPCFIVIIIIICLPPFFLPRFRNRIGWTRFSFCSTNPKSRPSDIVRPSPLRGPTRARGRRTLKRWTPRGIPDSRGGWRRGRHAVPRRGRESVLGRTQAGHRRRQVRVRRAVLRLRRTSRFDWVAGRGGWPRAVHPRSGGDRRRRRYYSNQGGSCRRHEERRPELSHRLGRHRSRTAKQTSTRKGKRVPPLSPGL
jgi:hypothetical protein